MSDPFRPHGLYPARLLHPWDFTGKNTGVGCCFLLQGISPTQGSNLGILHCKQTLYCLSHWGSPRDWHFILNIIVSNKIWNSKENLHSTNFYCLAILPVFLRTFPIGGFHLTVVQPARRAYFPKGDIV